MEEQIQFIKISPEDLSNRIASEIKTHLSDLLKSTKKEEPKDRDVTEPYLTRKEAAEILKINVATLWVWTKDGKLNSYGLGNRVYYKMSDIEKSMVQINSID